MWITRHEDIFYKLFTFTAIDAGERKSAAEFDRHTIFFRFMYWHRSRPGENYREIFPGTSSMRKNPGKAIWRCEPA